MSEQDQWKWVGEIAVLDGKIILPTITNDPGVYRLSFADSSHYIGETATLNDRMDAYHTPGQGVEAEFRIKRAIEQSNPVQIHVLTGFGYETRSKRCTVESRLIRELKAAGETLRNGGDLRERIAFHESEIARLQGKLLQQDKQTSGDAWHENMLANPQANAMADDLARSAARDIGLSEDEIATLIGITHAESSSKC